MRAAQDSLTMPTHVSDPLAGCELLSAHFGVETCLGVGRRYWQWQVASAWQAPVTAAAHESVGVVKCRSLGSQFITIPAAIQAKSYYNPPGNDSHETLIRLGDADRVIAESPLTIKAAR